VCRTRLHLIEDERRWACAVEHSYDVARTSYVNLLLAGQRRSRQPGDSTEMVIARHRFLATGAFDPLSEAVADVANRRRPAVALDVGCGDGRHTSHLDAHLVLGIDVAKEAVAFAARDHPAGWYAVASAADLPLDGDAVDVAINVFGPVFPGELARVVHHDGLVVAVHPGPEHLMSLRDLVYEDARPHQVKSPLRTETNSFTEIESVALRFPIVADAALLDDLFAMTPYRWHAPPDIRDRLSTATHSSFETTADVRVTTYRRTEFDPIAHPKPHPRNT
jgi:23S rRNA (guanine745-N1)-methyltransferase